MLPPELAALREGVALVEQEHVARLRVCGPGAFDVLDAVLARAAPLQVGRATPGLLLRDDGRVLADVLVCGEEQGALVLAEGITSEALAAHLRAVAPLRDAELLDLAAGYALVSVQGPFAWEIAGAIAGPDVFAAPFHTSFRLEEIEGLGVRGGKIGEYAYDLLVPRAEEATLRAIFACYETSHGLLAVDRTTVARCALEQGSFSVDLPGAAALTPLELQLQWRLDYARDVPGMAALRALRAAGRAGRITWFFAAGEAAAVPANGQALWLGRRRAGTVVDAFHSAALAGVVGTALLPREVAHAGLPLTWEPPDGPALQLRTVGPPLLNNRSTFVHPLQHNYAGRAHIDYPPLSRLA